MLLVSAGGLLAALAVFMVLDIRGQATPADQGLTVAAAPAPAPAQLPAPVPAPVPTSAPAPALKPAHAAPQQTSMTEGRAEQPPVAVRPSGPILLSSAEESFDITTRSEDPPATDSASYVSWMLAHFPEKQKFLAQKWERAQILLKTKNITHDRVLSAFLMTPREYFCRDPRRAYESAVLPIGYGQTISGPHMVARMTDYLDPQPDQKVLEIGTGSGYQSAVLSELSNHVYTIEIVEALARETDAIYRKLQRAISRVRQHPSKGR